MPNPKKMSPEDFAKLLASQNNEPQIRLTAKEKFEKFCRNKNSRRFHFKAIEHEGKLILFNGFGEELREFPNDFKGKREARVYALYEVFLKSPVELQLGGHKFDFV